VSTNFDLSDAWHKAWDEEVADREAQTGIKSSEWRAAGRRSKEWPNKEDDAWWQANGPEMVEAYIKWRNEGSEADWKIWEPIDGEPAIELGITAPIGGVTVKGFIDRVFVTPSGELVIVDLKTGSRNPDSDLQLGFYACLMEVAFGIRPKWGAYYKARDGRLIKPLVDLDYLSLDLLGGYLRDFVRAREARIFLPVIGSHCRTCGVANACAAVDGLDAPKYDPSHPQYQGKQEK
jgi:RecB family exonuclease